MATNAAQYQPNMDRPASDFPAYEPIAVATFTDEQLLQALGPAQTVRDAIP